MKIDLLGILNESLDTGVIPERWKIAKIKMLLKPNKSPKLANSYRPISLTSNLAKCLEKIILNRLTRYLNNHKIISKYQSGFRKGYCTKDHILRFSQNIQNNFNKNLYTGAVMFDMEKAFDKVWHNGLLYKLNQLDLPKYIVYWIQQFITERSFFIQINDSVSYKYKIEAGVPQGCILSPILFSIYFSDISEVINSNKAIYADDLAIWSADENINEIKGKLQADINNIETFCQTWCLKINSAKSNYTIFTNAGKRKNYNKIYGITLLHENNEIKLEPNPTFLGITFDPKLSFNQHIDSITPKIFNRINLLRIMKGKMWKSKPNFLINLYKSLIRPIIEYANFPLISTSNTTFARLQKLENKIIRLCLSSSLYDTTVQIHKNANIELLSPRLIQISTKYIANIVNNKINTPILELISNQEQIDCENNNIIRNRQKRYTCLDGYKKQLKALKL